MEIVQNEKPLSKSKYFYFLFVLCFLFSCQGKEKRLIEKKWTADVDAYLENLAEEVKKQYSEEELKLMQEMLSNIYIEFRADGKIITNIDGEEKIGDWDWEEDNFIKVDFEGVDDMLTVMELTESKLLLGRGSQAMAITFVPSE